MVMHYGKRRKIKGVIYCLSIPPFFQNLSPVVKYSASTKMGIKLLENNFKVPCSAGPLPLPPLQHIQPLCGYTEPLGESIPPRRTWALSHWKTAIRSHVMLPPSPLYPLTTHTTTVWIHGTTWWINPASTNMGIKLLENNFKVPCLGNAPQTPCL